MILLLLVFNTNIYGYIYNRYQVASLYSLNESNITINYLQTSMNVRKLSVETKQNASTVLVLISATAAEDLITIRKHVHAKVGLRIIPMNYFSMFLCSAQQQKIK